MLPPRNIAATWRLLTAAWRLTIKLVFAHAFVSGSTALMGQLMGNRVLHRCPFAQRGPATLCLHLGSQLLLERFVLADAQASALPARGFGTLGAQGTRHTPQPETGHACLGPWGRSGRGQVTCIPAKSK